MPLFRLKRIFLSNGEPILGKSLWIWLLDGNVGGLMLKQLSSIFDCDEDFCECGVVDGDFRSTIYFNFWSLSFPFERIQFISKWLTNFKKLIIFWQFVNVDLIQNFGNIFSFHIV